MIPKEIKHLFDQCMCESEGCGSYYVKGTLILYYVNQHSWHVDNFRADGDRDRDRDRDREADKEVDSISSKPLTFEEALDMMPEKIRTQFLFHLDIFTGAE